ncbi:hypothetical protein HUS23_03825 [Ectothiorhodospiraceae bacterium 2226]|nr:hypothetical protein HUS23_03825 [Ectothiorhodospiraceae bacterium 2226]
MTIRKLAAAAAAIGLSIGLIAPGAVLAQQPATAQLTADAAQLRMHDVGAGRAVPGEASQQHGHTSQRQLHARTPEQTRQRQQTRERARANEGSSRAQGGMKHERQRAPAASAGRR